jgi:hypothetical protein
VRHAGVTQTLQGAIVLPGRFARAAPFVLAGVTVATLAAVASADAGGVVASAFFVAKSENRNQVHYGVHVDAGCSPLGAAPVFAYWRMLEHGPSATEPLLSREVPAYGLADQRVVERGLEGGRTAVRLRALGNRTIDVVTTSRDGACTATATTSIDGQPAVLASVYAQLKWPWGVDYLMLSGRALSDGHPVRERLEP